MKKSLNQFKKAQTLSIEEAINTKGGIRFMTYSLSEYRKKKRALRAIGITNDKMKRMKGPDAAGVMHYCIEW